MNWQKLLKSGVELLKSHNIEDYEFDALQLILSFFNGSYSQYCSYMFDEASSELQDKYYNMLDLRIHKEPLQYILGKWDFYESEFFVGSGVLIPRPETEELVDACVKIIRQNDIRVVYDLCTGSGCIGLSLAKKFPDIEVFLFDYYDDALFYTNKNLSAFRLTNVRIIKHNIFEEYNEDLPDAQLIVSNPPYINSAEIALLQKEVKKEPVTALDGGSDGLMFYRGIYDVWKNKLIDNGFFAFECGETQSDKIADIFSNGFSANIKKDSFGTERFVYLQKEKKGD